MLQLLVRVVVKAMQVGVGQTALSASPALLPNTHCRPDVCPFGVGLLGTGEGLQFLFDEGLLEGVLLRAHLI